MSGFRSWLILPFLLLGFLADAEAARSWEEISRETQIAQANIQAAQKLISQAEGKAQEALNKVQNAEHFEGPQWIELEKAMKDYGETFSQQIGVIDVNVKHLLQVNPSASVPAVETNPPQFKASVKGLEAVRDDLKRTVLKAKKFKADRMQDDAKIRLEMEQRTEQQYGDTVLNLAGVPLNSDGSINYGDLVASLLPFPAGLVNTGLSITFGLYYYADEMKSGVRQIKTFKEMIAFADQAIVNAESSQRSAEQGLQYLNGYWQQKEELMKEFYKLRNGWSTTADQSRKTMKEEDAKEFEQALEKPHFPAKFGYWDPPMQASEIEPEAKSAIRELESAALAAMQGGDPDAFAALIASYYRKYADQTEQALKATKAAQDAANKAWQVYDAASASAYQTYAATIRGHCSCERDFLEAAARAYQAACNAAYNNYKPFALALNRAQREQSRISLIASMISNGADQLSGQLSNYGYTANSNLTLRLVEARQAMEEATSDLGALSGAIPYRWSLDAIKNFVAGLDDYIARGAYWGSAPLSLQNELQTYADSVRALGERTRRTLPEYRKTLAEALQLARTSHTELKQALDKDALIIGSYRDGTLSNMRWPWWGGEPWVRSGDTRREHLDSLRKYFDEMLKVSERDDLDGVAGFDFEGMARRIEEKAEEMGAIVDRINTFSYRLAGVSGKLDKVSRTLTKQGLYVARSKAAAALANEELTTGAWSSLAAALDKLLPKLEPLKQAGYPYFLSGGAGVRPRLMAAQNILYVAAQYRMRNYISQHGRGWFAPVPPADLKLLSEGWTELQPLYAQFDALAASERSRQQAAEKTFPDISGLQSAYSAIPAQYRGTVGGSYQRYMGEDNYLRAYVSSKIEGTEPVGDTAKNQVLAHLEDWIGGYPAAEKAWKEELARLEREAEERQRQYEEQKKQKATSNLASVQALYPRFTAAYQSRNLNGVLKLLSPDWQTDNGTTRYDLEETLSNSFRVFDSVTFTISGLSVQAVSESVYQAKYNVHLVGTINRLNIKHEEKSDVTDTVTITSDGPVITHTTGGSFWIK